MTERPVHASFKTKGLPRDWEAANDGRWMHVREPDPFAAVVDEVTCEQCRHYIGADARVVTP